MIESTTKEGVAVLAMRHGKANALAGRSLAAARRLAAMGPAFALTKRQLRQRFLERVHELAGLDAEVDAIWQAPPTLDRIQSFMTSLK